MARMIFYDVESLKNIFTVALYKEPQENLLDGHIDIFYLSTIPIIDFDEITKRIYMRNGNFKGTVSYHDFRDMREGVLFASIFGGMDDGSRLAYGIADFPSDIAYQSGTINGNVYYLGGYNSYNYDTTIIAYMLANMFPDAAKRFYNVEWDCRNDERSTKLSPQSLRRFNDILFADKAHMPNALRTLPNANQIRRNMLLSGRHVDIARLNEKQQKVALKRLLGTLGYQILESDKLSNTTSELKSFDEVCELIAYNVSDVVNLAKLSHHKVYTSNFELKQGLLDSYPEIVIQNYKKDMDLQTAVLRKDRKVVDSSSSQLASRALCPIGHLSDVPVVSFDYPAINKAIEQNRTPENILYVTNEWFCSKFPDPLSEPRQYWDRVYRFYSYIEGKNFDEILNTKVEVVPRHAICMPYFDLNGNPTSCYVTFSVGGIHGAEYNKKLYDAHVARYKKFKQDVVLLSGALAYYDIPKTFSTSKKTGRTTVKYGKPILTDAIKTTDAETQARIFSKLKELTIDGITYHSKDYVNGSGKWKDIKEPKLFKGYNDPLPGHDPDNTIYNCKELDKAYTYTSYGTTEHEDFTSYYPNLLIQLEAFLNEMLGYDRYNEIFGQKESLGKQMKDESYTKEERSRFSIKRNGTKLILNSASGAGDAKFDNPIRMNNRIISMRIIGQLFTWRIGQAQTFAGARVISTNTDGLYVIPVPPLTIDESRRVLAEESANIHVEIEPEPVYLISKDTNNRLEYDLKKKKIVAAGGGSLSCFDGPTPTQALSHPAVIDKALSMYLLELTGIQNGTDALDAPFDETIGRRILDDIRNDNEISLVDRALYFQNIVSSSPSTNSYNFAYKVDDPEAGASEIDHIVQHYNRVFYFKKHDYTVHMKRIHMRKATGLKKGERPPHPTKESLQWYCIATGDDPVAVDDTCVNNYKELAISRITGISPDVNILIENHDLYQMPDQQLMFILNELDMDVYLHLLESTYKNWQNSTPEFEVERTSELDDDVA